VDNRRDAGKLKGASGERVVEKALELGADLAGIAQMPAGGGSPGRSLAVIALSHPEDKPDLDWWKDGCPGGTEGNRILMSVTGNLVAWLKQETGMEAEDVPYSPDRGGVFLKDAAVMAGLGCIGKNNLLVTREFGPRARLRAMLINERLPGMGPIDFDPCQRCDMPCRKACPQEAFVSGPLFEKKDADQRLPARTGHYSKSICNVQMSLDVDSHDMIEIQGRPGAGKLVRYCRRCELACPIGKEG
jgi:epoxyqueuosine reductase